MKWKKLVDETERNGEDVGLVIEIKEYLNLLYFDRQFGKIRKLGLLHIFGSLAE